MKKTLILLLLSGLGFSAQAADGLTSEKQSALIKVCFRFAATQFKSYLL